MSMWTSFKRITSAGFVGFWRNAFVSFTAIFVMTVTLFVIGIALFLGQLLDASLSQIQAKVDINVYFVTTAPEAEIISFKGALAALPEVAAVEYTSRDQALINFRERHGGDQLTLQALDELGDNPLGASLEVRAKDPSQYESIAKFVTTEQSSNGTLSGAIDKVNFFQNKTAIDRLSNIISTSRSISFAIAFIFGIASVLIAFNTIRLAIYTSRDEISVMNLVGASHWYVRGPFIISGILYGFVSAIIVLLILYPLTVWLGPPSEQFFGSYNVFTHFISTFPTIFLLVMGSGIGLGGLSSYLAVARYLNN